MARNGPKGQKFLSVGPYYFRNNISYDLYLWCICMYKRMISAGIFFIFFLLVFGIIKGGKGGGDGGGGGVVKR